MSPDTPLDRAVASMAESPDDDAAHLAFMGMLAQTELYVPLSGGDDETATPETLDRDGTPHVIAYDTPDRVADHGGSGEHAVLTGRALAQMLEGQGAGLALNAGLSGAWLLPPEAVDWLAETTARTPGEDEAMPQSFHRPGALPELLIAALDQRLARAGALAQAAWLAGVSYAGGRRGHILVIVGPAPGAEPVLAQAIGEALTFSGVEAGELDVTFLPPGHSALGPLAKVGLRFDLPAPPVPAPPGGDAPPRLR